MDSSKEDVNREAIITGFDHEQGSLIDSRVHEAGVFVQVWNERRNGRMDSDGRVILSYQRTHGRVEDVMRAVPCQGEFSWLEVRANQRTFIYRDSPAFQRVEIDLPSGRVVVDDPRKGVKLQRIWTNLFDVAKNSTDDSSLSDAAVLQLQRAGREWYVSFFQIVAAGEKVSKELTHVERYRGRELKELIEFTNRSVTMRVTYQNE